MLRQLDRVVLPHTMTAASNAAYGLIGGLAGLAGMLGLLVLCAALLYVYVERRTPRPVLPNAAAESESAPELASSSSTESSIPAVATMSLTQAMIRAQLIERFGPDYGKPLTAIDTLDWRDGNF